MVWMAQCVKCGSWGEYPEADIGFLCEDCWDKHFKKNGRKGKKPKTVK